jgi:hypothetical protein
MPHQIDESSLSQDETESRCVLAIRCMKRIARNITTNCIHSGEFHQAVAAVEPIASSEWSPTADDLGRLSSKMNEIYYILIPAIEVEEARITGDLQLYIEQMNARQDAYNQIELKKSKRERTYKSVEKVPFISRYYKEKLNNSITKSFSTQNELCLSKHIVGYCEADLSTRKRLLLGLNNLMTVMVDVYNELEEAY